MQLIRELKRNKDIDLLKPFRKKKTNKLDWNRLNKEIHQISLGLYERKLRKFIKEGFVNEELEGIFAKQYKENLTTRSIEVIKEYVLKLLRKM